MRKTTETKEHKPKRRNEKKIKSGKNVSKIQENMF